MALFKNRKKPKPQDEVPVQNAEEEQTDHDPEEIPSDQEDIEDMEDDPILLEKAEPQPEAVCAFEEELPEAGAPEAVQEPAVQEAYSQEAYSQEDLEKTQQLELQPLSEDQAAYLDQQKLEGMDQQKLWKDGVQQFGEHEVAGYRYYFDPDNEGKAAQGLVSIPAKLSLEGEDKTVFCALYGNMMSGSVNVEGSMCWFDPETYAMASSRLVERDGDFWYYDAFGTQFRGLITLNGKRKYFSLEDGKMARGITRIPASLNGGEEKTVFFDENGDMYFGLLEQDGKIRCFDHWDGHMYTGLTHLTSEYGGPKTVYFDSDGAMVTGSVMIHGKYMYFARSGDLITNSTVRIGDQIYYYNQKGYRYYGPRYLKGKWKYFDEKDGHMLTGLVSLKDEDSPTGLKTVLYDQKGNMVFGPQILDGRRKCFDREDGHMFTGLTFLSREYGGPKTVYFDEHGDMQTGSVLVSGAWMYFRDDGSLVRSSLVDLDGHTYYYNDIGVRQFGQVCLNGKWKYFDRHTGRMARGLVFLDNVDEARGEKTVYYDENGDMLFGLQEIGGSWKYFDEYDGHMHTGLVHLSDEEGRIRTAYFDEEGNMVYGPRVVSGREMFFSNDGGMVRNTLVEYEGEIYYYDQNGHKFRGQTRINGKWKLFDLRDGRMIRGLHHLDTREEPGGEKTVLYDQDGNMVYGMQEIDGRVKCFDLASGAMKTGFVHLSRDYGQEKNVYFDPEGSMVFGQAVINGQSYLFDENTGELLKHPDHTRSWEQSANLGLDEAARKNNALLIWNELKNQGWTMEASAGLIACMEEVSRLNPGYEQDGARGLLGLHIDSGTGRWFEEHHLDPGEGRSQILRLLHESRNALRWKTGPDYPISFREFTTLDFRPGYAALAFLNNYLNRASENPARLQARAGIWFNYLKENEN